MTRAPRTRSLLLLALWCLGSTGCLSVLQPSAAYQANEKLLSLTPLVVYQGASGPLSYQTAAGKDGQKFLPTSRVQGRACQRGIQIPIFSILAASLNYDGREGPSGLSGGWGDGSFRAALDDARRKLPTGAILFDLRADLQQRSILTIYLEQCLRIDAGVLLPVPTA